MQRLAILCACLLPVHADEVILTEGSRLSGTVTAMADDGRISLNSPLSFEPFQLKSEQIERVLFAQGKGPADDSDAMLVLANGDQFPCELLGIDPKLVRVRTVFAGPLEIPRDRVSTVQLGVRPRKIIYKGPTDNGWNIRSGWRYEPKGFVADGGGTISRVFDIPGSFALRFRMAWKTTPNLQVYFADELMETGGKADRYQFSFDGSGGFKLVRQQSGDSYPYKDMHAIRRSPDDYADSQVDVEIRVDRQLQKVHLLLNGEEEGEYGDPLKVTPPGKGIMFQSKIGADDEMTISNIEVREWDATAVRHQNEKRGDETRDVVITRTSNRGTGEIIGMRDSKDGPLVLYKNPHNPEPMELPASDVSTLFFAKPAQPAVAKSPAPWQISLRGRGGLALSGCSFTGESLAAEHPLLGKLAIRRDAIARLERKAVEPPVEEEAKPEEGDDEEE